VSKPEKERQMLLRLEKLIRERWAYKQYHAIKESMLVVDCPWRREVEYTLDQLDVSRML